MLIIADSSPLITLSICEALPLLEQLFQTVKVPSYVFGEVILEGKPQAKSLRAYLRDKVVTVAVEEILVTSAILGRGELEAMALYKKLHANLLLVDDRDARKIARLNGIQIIGSLGILLLAKQQGLIMEVAPLIAKIQEAHIFIGEELIRLVLQRAGELVS
ncbi:MAG: DUF3368 domain-containing protein [SAR324 cluster bacterium]|nr:DUF3368 domain-containing protein [SAR324 cluster bacterium]